PSSSPPTVGTSRSSFDLLVVGAGPAGAHAALAAAEAGLSVVLLDEAPAAGGQVWRAPPCGFRKAYGAHRSPEESAGAALRRRLAASAVESRFGRRIWNLRTGFEAHAVGPDGS